MENEEREIPNVSAEPAGEDAEKLQASPQGAQDQEDPQGMAAAGENPALVPDVAIRMEDDFPQLKQPAPVNKAAKGKRVLAIILGVIVLATGAAASYMYYQKTRQQPVVPDKGAIVKSALENMKSIKAYDYDGKASFAVDMREKDESGQDVSGNIVFNIASKGSADFRNQDGARIYSAITLDGNKDMSDGSGKGEGRLDVELAYLDDTYYVKLNDARLDDGTEYPTETVKQLEGVWEMIKGNWYFMSQDRWRELSGATASGGEEGPQDEVMMAENAAKINEIIGKYDLVGFEQDLGDEQIGSVDAYHFRIRLDGRSGVDLVIELAKEGMLMQGDEEAAKSLEEELKEKAEDVEKAKELVDFVLNKVNAEIWIGKNDNLIYRIKVDGNFDKSFQDSFLAKYRELYEQEGETDDGDIEEINFNFSLEYTLSDFNTAEVRQPENAKDLAKIIEAIQSQSMSSYPSGVDTDKDGLTDSQESFYGSDPKKADTDGDGYLDGDEVAHGYDPIVAGSAKLDYAKLYNL